MDNSNTTLIETIKQRIASREDSEFVQAMLRTMMVLFMLGYFLSPYFRIHIETDVLSKIYILNGISIGICVLIIANTIIYTSVSPTRRVVGLFHDAVFVSIALYLGEAYTMPFAVLYLWFTVGNGFRYGLRYLFISFFAALTGFSYVVSVSEYWQSNVPITITIYAMMIMIPPYIALLTQSLHSTNTIVSLQANNDPLIPVYNRRGFKEAFYKSIRRNDDDEFHHTLLFCDLDKFKEVNDVGGHAAGDQMLFNIAKLLKEQVREGDVVARLGGDEFGLLLKSCPLKKEIEIADTICKKINVLVLHWGGAELGVGVSVGVVGINKNDEDFGRVLKFADAACYAAKNSGGNKAHVFEEPLSELDSKIFSTNQS